MTVQTLKRKLDDLTRKMSLMKRKGPIESQLDQLVQAVDDLVTILQVMNQPTRKLNS